LVPTHEILWGLGVLSLTREGRARLARTVGRPPARCGRDVAAPDGFITRASLERALQDVLEREGGDRTLDVLEQLMRCGFEVAKRSGASMSPFVGSTLETPPQPTADDAQAWDAYAEELADRIASYTDYGNSDLGAQVLTMKTGARGELRHLVALLGSRGSVIDAKGAAVPIRHGFGAGLTPEEMFACVALARQALAQTAREVATTGYGIRAGGEPKGFSVIPRAMRAKHPGAVFARAAATGEVDPLTDIDSRLFVGFPPTPSR
jgi:hypothetical protein